MKLFKKETIEEANERRKNKLAELEFQKKVETKKAEIRQQKNKSIPKKGEKSSGVFGMLGDIGQGFQNVGTSVMSIEQPKKKKKEEEVRLG